MSARGHRGGALAAVCQYTSHASLQRMKGSRCSGDSARHLSFWRSCETPSLSTWWENARGTGGTLAWPAPPPTPGSATAGFEGGAREDRRRASVNQSRALL